MFIFHCLYLLLSHFSHVRLFATLWNVVSQTPLSIRFSRLCPWNSPGKNTRVGCHALLQGIFSTQGLKSSLLSLLHWQAGSLPLAPPEKLYPLLYMAFKDGIKCYTGVIRWPYRKRVATTLKGGDPWARGWGLLHQACKPSSCIWDKESWVRHQHLSSLGMESTTPHSCFPEDWEIKTWLKLGITWVDKRWGICSKQNLKHKLTLTEESSNSWDTYIAIVVSDHSLLRYLLTEP